MRAWGLTHDRAGDGRPRAGRSVGDGGTRGCPAPEARRGPTAEVVIGARRAAAGRRGRPGHIRRGNGPGFVAAAPRGRPGGGGGRARCVGPGSPWGDGSAESCHSRPRAGRRNAEPFAGRAEARPPAAEGTEAYHHERPRRGPGDRTPAAFAAPCPRAEAA